MKTLVIGEDTAVVDGIVSILADKVGIKDTEIAHSIDDALTHIESCTQVDMASALFNSNAKETCKIKLVLIDEDMKNGNPADFLKGVRSKFDKKSLPVILVTNGEDKDELMKGLKSGANGFVLKPVNGDLLNRKLAEVMGKTPAKSSVNSAAAGAFKIFSSSTTPVKKREKVSPLLKMMSGKKTKSGSERLIGAYYSGKKEDKNTNPLAKGEDASKEDAKETLEPPLVNDGSKIDGHYHEEVNVVGGGTNCFWAKENSKGKVVVEYLSAKGKPTGIEVKVVTRDEFTESFKLCTQDTCQILKRLAEEE